MPDEIDPDEIDDANTTGADLSYHALPEGRPWAQALRSPGLPWLVGFIIVNWVAFGLAMGVHGAGFDDCEAMPTSSDRRTMALIAAAAVLVPAGLALWKLRRRSLMAALGGVAVSAFAWFILVGGDNRNCGVPL